MIESIENIKKLLIADVCEPILERHIVLREKKDNADMEVEVDVGELSGRGLKIHAEEGEEQRFHPSIVNAKKGYRRSCDYLIIGPNTSGIDVYFIELKTAIINEKDQKFEDACSQIRYTVPVWDYLVSMLDKHFDKKPHIKEHFAVIAGNTPTTKNPIRQPRNRNFKLTYYTGELLLKSLKCPTSS